MGAINGSLSKHGRQFKPVSDARRRYVTGPDCVPLLGVGLGQDVVDVMKVAAEIRADRRTRSSSRGRRCPFWPLRTRARASRAVGDPWFSRLPAARPPRPRLRQQRPGIFEYQPKMEDLPAPASVRAGSRAGAAGTPPDPPLGLPASRRSEARDPDRLRAARVEPQGRLQRRPGPPRASRCGSRSATDRGARSRTPGCARSPPSAHGSRRRPSSPPKKDQ